MAGNYVTQQREILAAEPGVAIRPGTLPPVIVPNAIPASTQKTVSWRSGYDPVFWDYKSIYTKDRFRGPFDTGHTFWSQRRIATANVRDIEIVGTGGYTWRGPLTVRGGSTAGNPTWEDPPAFNATYYGPEAIARTAPTQSRAQLLTAAAETFRDGIPKYVVGSGALGPQGLGHNALTNEFGWKPLLSDINKIASALRDTTGLLRQLSRDDGRLVRRRLKFPLLAETMNDTVSLVNEFIPWTAGGVEVRFITGAPTSIEHTVSTTEKVWFSGAYVYRLPIPDSLLSTLSAYETAYDKVLGTRPSLDRLWEVLPFSWLVDWVANVQSGLTAAAALAEDGLVLHHGYLMRFTSRHDKLTAYNVPIRGGRKRTISRGCLTQTKERFQATPFGFGLQPSAFTERQWAILAALGLSKTNRRLAW